MLVLLLRCRRAYGWPEVPELLNFSRSRQHLRNVGCNYLVLPDFLVHHVEKCVPCPQSLEGVASQLLRGCALSAEHPPMRTRDLDLEVQGLCVRCSLSLQQLLQCKDGSAALFQGVKLLPCFYRADVGLTFGHVWCTFEGAYAGQASHVRPLSRAPISLSLSLQNRPAGDGSVGALLGEGGSWTPCGPPVTS